MKISIVCLLCKCWISFHFRCLIFLSLVWCLYPNMNKPMKSNYLLSSFRAVSITVFKVTFRTTDKLHVALNFYGIFCIIFMIMSIFIDYFSLIHAKLMQTLWTSKGMKKKKKHKMDENDSRCVSSIPCLPMHWTCIMANASNFKQDHVLIPMRQKRHIAYK